MARHGKTRPLAGALGELLRSRGWDRRLAPYQALEHWDDVFPDLQGVASPLEVRGRTLVVAVCDQVWVNQLAFMAEELRRRMNTVVGEDFFTGIRFLAAPEKVKQTAP